MYNSSCENDKLTNKHQSNNNNNNNYTYYQRKERKTVKLIENCIRLFLILIFVVSFNVVLDSTTFLVFAFDHNSLKLTATQITTKQQQQQQQQPNFNKAIANQLNSSNIDSSSISATNSHLIVASPSISSSSSNENNGSALDAASSLPLNSIQRDWLFGTEDLSEAEGRRASSFSSEHYSSNDFRSLPSSPIGTNSSRHKNSSSSSTTNKHHNNKSKNTKSHRNNNNNSTTLTTSNKKHNNNNNEDTTNDETSASSNGVFDELEEGESGLAGSSKEPECATKGRYYCTYKEDYPSKLVTEVTKYYKWPLEKLFRDLHAQIMPKLAYDSTGNLVCDSITRVIRPGWARNTNDRWLVVINTESYHQYVTEVVCQYGSNSRCNFIPPCYYSSCQQRYNTQKLLVIDPNNPYRGPFLSEFLFPSCCVCYVPSISESFHEKHRPAPTTIFQRTIQQEAASNLYPPQYTKRTEQVQVSQAAAEDIIKTQVAQNSASSSGSLVQVDVKRAGEPYKTVFDEPLAQSTTSSKTINAVAPKSNQHQRTGRKNYGSLDSSESSASLSVADNFALVDTDSMTSADEHPGIGDHGLPIESKT